MKKILALILALVMLLSLTGCGEIPEIVPSTVPGQLETTAPTGSTENTTQPTKPTETDPTVPTTQAPTQPSTEEPTQPPTQPPTEKPTEPPSLRPSLSRRSPPSLRPSRLRKHLRSRPSTRMAGTTARKMYPCICILTAICPAISSPRVRRAVWDGRAAALSAIRPAPPLAVTRSRTGKVCCPKPPAGSITNVTSIPMARAAVAQSGSSSPMTA